MPQLEINSPRKRLRLICDTQDKIDLAVSNLEKSALTANDVETHPYQRSMKNATVEQFALTVCAFACETGDFVFPLQNSKYPGHGAPENIDAIFMAIKHINSLSIPQVGHNFTYDVQWYIRYGMPVRNWQFDTMVMFWALWPMMPKSLSFVASILLDDHQYWKQGRKDDNWLDFLNYAAKDVWATLRICKLLIGQLLEDSPEAAQYRRNFLHAMLRCYAATEMNAYGAAIDEEVMHDIQVTLEADAEIALKRLQYLVADPQFNPRSPKQMKELIYEILGEQPKNAKGRPVKDYAKASTGQVVQRLVKQTGPIHSRIMRAIEANSVPQKQLSNVVNMPQFPIIGTDRRRFLTSFDGVGTITTRYASRQSSFGHGGNAQNIRKKYRKFIRADPGGFFLEIDFSGADAVYVAFESEDETLINIFEQGLDLHAMTGSLLFTQWTYDEIIKGKKAGLAEVIHPIYGVRQISKKVGHGANYLMAKMTLLMTATIPTIIGAAKANGHLDAGGWKIPQLADYCGELETRYRSGYKRLQRNAWYHDIADHINEHKAVETIYGYTLPITDPPTDAVLRLAAATYGQASTAGRTNAALYELKFGIRTVNFRDGPASDRHEKALKVTSAEHGIRIVRQTHDSLTFHCDSKAPKLEAGLRNIFHVMRRPFVCKGREFALGIEADVSINWAHNDTRVSCASDIKEWLQANEELFR